MVINVDHVDVIIFVGKVVHFGKENVVESVLACSSLGNSNEGTAVNMKTCTLCSYCG